MERIPMAKSPRDIHFHCNSFPERSHSDPEQAKFEFQWTSEIVAMLVLGRRGPVWQNGSLKGMRRLHNVCCESGTTEFVKRELLGHQGGKHPVRRLAAEKSVPRERGLCP